MALLSLLFLLQQFLLLPSAFRNSIEETLQQPPPGMKGEQGEWWPTTMVEEDADDPRQLGDNNAAAVAMPVTELPTNSTRYEKLLAYVSAETLWQMWTGWAILAYIGFFFSASLCIAILASKRTRANPFNYYLLTLTLPDLLFNAWCGITCSMNASVRHYWSRQLCNFQGFYCVFSIGSNLWLGAIIAYEIHQMLRYSRRRRRYFAPTRRKITRQALAVYTACAAFASLGLLDNDDGPDFLPMHYRASGGGAACVPLEIDRPSTIFFWAFLIPFYTGLPLLYVLYVAADIAIRQLLPTRTNGRRRLLALYFFQILFSFTLAWLPFVVLVHAAGPYVPVWVLWTAGAISHLQSALTVTLAMMKPDIRRAVFRLWTLQICFGGGADKNTTERQQRPDNDDDEPTHLHDNDHEESGSIELFLRRSFSIGMLGGSYSASSSSLANRRYNNHHRRSPNNNNNNNNSSRQFRPSPQQQQRQQQQRESQPVDKDPADVVADDNVRNRLDEKDDDDDDDDDDVESSTEPTSERDHHSHHVVDDNDDDNDDDDEPDNDDDVSKELEEGSGAITLDTSSSSQQPSPIVFVRASEGGGGEGNT